MIFKAFCIYDSKALCYQAPIFMDSVGRMLREFSDGANSPNSYLSKHPGDYQLYEVGFFDDNDGSMTSVVPMKLLGCAVDFVKSKALPSMAEMARATQPAVDVIKEALSNGS